MYCPNRTFSLFLGPYLIPRHSCLKYPHPKRVGRTTNPVWTQEKTRMETHATLELILGDWWGRVMSRHRWRESRVSMDTEPIPEKRKREVS